MRPTSESHPTATPVRLQSRHTSLGLLVLLALALAAVACTGGSLRGTSTGWSPVVAELISVDTGGQLSEGTALSALDDALTVTNPRDFAPGQILLIDREQILVTGMENGELLVERGVNNTRPRSHPDGSAVFTLGDLSTVFVGTKQGEVKALEDAGQSNPSLLWSYEPPE